MNRFLWAYGVMVDMGKVIDRAKLKNGLQRDK